MDSTTKESIGKRAIMNVSMLFAVMAGGALGALTRLLAREFMVVYGWTYVTLSTLVVNVIGSFIAGFLLIYWSGVEISPNWRAAIVIGFLGSLTTFSTFSTETLIYWQKQEFLRAMFYILGNLSFSLLAVSIGAWIGGRIQQ